MCGPAVLPAIMVAGAVMSAASTVMQAQASAGQASYQAQVARNNTIIANRNADDALKRGSIEEDKARQRTALIMGSQRAKLAGQGSALDDGSPLDIQMDTAQLGELDALTVRSNYDREAYGYRVQGMNQSAQANLYDTKSSMGLSTWLSAGGSILGGAAKAYGAWGGGGGASGAGGLGKNG